MVGTLYIVATPIGNLQDITLRALETLKNVELIACEDTRQTSKLLHAYQIQKPLLSFYDHNERSRTPQLLHRLKAGESIALVSDAGTPLISDPGYSLVRELVAEGIRIESIPGPCAAIAALVVSGLPTDSFYFVGFLSPKRSARLKKFEALKEMRSTLIFYESTHRIQKFLHDAHEVFGDRQVVVVREMTKKFEEALRGKLGEIGHTVQPRSWKGEFVVLLAGAAR